MYMRSIRAFVLGAVLMLVLVRCSGNDVDQLLNEGVPTTTQRFPTAAPQALATSQSSGEVAQAAPRQETAPLPQGVFQELSAQEQIIEDVYNRAAPAVVRIQTGQGLGSGFLIDRNGYIVTNNHVIEGAQGGQVLVSFSGLFETVGTLVGTDPDSDTAVVKVDELPNDVQPVELGDSDALRIGQLTIAIGNPLQQDRTVTTGIVSALGRTITEDQRGYAIGGAIQTDASINPGNSGGPLLNAQGQVIGMNTAILSQSGTSSGIGFAVPVNLIKKVAPALISNGRYDHPYLGVGLRQITTFDARQNNLPSPGVLISPNDGSGPVAQAGLRGDAILIAINGTEVTSEDDVISYLEVNTSPGDVVTLSIVDGNGQQRSLQVQLGARPRIQSGG